MGGLALSAARGGAAAGKAGSDEGGAAKMSLINFKRILLIINDISIYLYLFK